ncbi:hypothetical protein CIPAW_11G032000 [Carya illinoinensis]|uniref:Uncharacterized protein n=1 Tax=Carya illinoinensis TaxID=32201 RepID=A0A8T1NUL5_CARIL|nr:hypothetical protein CIPAW_11G032000 [Carya illinoinensis]
MQIHFLSIQKPSAPLWVPHPTPPSILSVLVPTTKLHPFLLPFKRQFYLHQALECTKVKQLGKSRSLLDLGTLKTLSTFNIPSKNRATSPCYISEVMLFLLNLAPHISCLDS